MEKQGKVQEMFQKFIEVNAEHIENLVTNASGISVALNITTICLLGVVIFLQLKSSRNKEKI